MKGLYIHIPFCVKKCDYCDFVSYTNCEKKYKSYIETLIGEMCQYKGERINSVFIGGGTPTVLTAEMLEFLLKSIQEIFLLSNDCEFSIEANPKTLDKKKLIVLKNGGVNRLSIGVQSFNDDELKQIGRIHTAEDAYNTVCMAKNMGFDNINLDLMSALPFQTEEKLMYSLKKAVSLNPTHISCYSLIIEDGTPLEKRYSRGEVTIPNEVDDRAMYRLVCGYLEQNGYKQYEISNFAKKDYECKHNIKYWKCEEYIGVGTAAHSYIGNVRFYNTENIEMYMNGEYRAGEEILDISDKIEEFMIMGLRMKDGISQTEFKIRFGKDINDVYSDIINKFQNNGLILKNKDRLYLSERGIDISNSVLCEFIM